VTSQSSYMCISSDVSLTYGLTFSCQLAYPLAYPRACPRSQLARSPANSKQTAPFPRISSDIMVYQLTALHYLGDSRASFSVNIRVVAWIKKDCHQTNPIEQSISSLGTML